MKVKRTERGWAGHFVCADRCLFRRNTLLEFGEVRIVVSTIGMMVDIHTKGYPNNITYDKIGLDRYFETMVFHAKRVAERWWDADVYKQVDFDSPWSIGKLDADDVANDMHEIVVDEITQKLENGIINNLT